MPPDLKTINIIIITGYAGSGKSTAMAAFEDAGFYCIDNMPVALLPDFLKLSLIDIHDISGLAFVMDLREKKFINNHSKVFSDLIAQGYHCQIIFLKASENVLMNRYSQTRRHHPLSGNEKTLVNCIRAEKKQLSVLAKNADRIIDTSDCNVHELKFIIFDILRKIIKPLRMGINILSFGFKYGNPVNTDLQIDVRFLANPYFVDELKPLSGETEQVTKYLLKKAETGLFINKYIDLLDYLIPLYEKEGKAYLTIAVGCTGGRHRSVVIANVFYQHLIKKGQLVRIAHRDIEK